MKSSFCIDLQRFMLIPTKFPLSPIHDAKINNNIGLLKTQQYYLILFMYWFHKILWIKNKQKKGLYRSKAPFNGFV